MRYSRKCKSRGLTLIEVIASIAIMSTLLVMMLSIHSRHIRQINLAFDKQTSEELLDGLLAIWFAEDDPFPANTSGGFSNNSEYFWTSTVMPSKKTNPSWNTRTIRVEIVQSRTNEAMTVVDLIDAVAPQAPNQQNGS